MRSKELLIKLILPHSTTQEADDPVRESNHRTMKLAAVYKCWLLVGTP